MEFVQLVSNVARTRGTGVIALAIGMTLVFLAVPRSGATLVSLPAPIAIFQLERGQTLTPQRLLEIEESLREALKYDVYTAELNTQLSFLSLHRLLLKDRSNASREEFQTVLRNVETALKRRPLDAYLWTRYTHLSYLLDGLSPYTLAGLDRSFRYGSKEMQLFQFRMTLCLEEWEKLPPALREASREQIEFGASHTTIWGYILADLNETARIRLLSFLASTSADVERAQRVENSVRRARSTN